MVRALVITCRTNQQNNWFFFSQDNYQSDLKADSILSANVWSFPPQNSFIQTVWSIIYAEPVPIQSQKDQICWGVNGSDFSVKEVRTITCGPQKKAWVPIVWESFAITKHPFYLGRTFRTEFLLKKTYKGDAFISLLHAFYV